VQRVRPPRSGLLNFSLREREGFQGLGEALSYLLTTCSLRDYGVWAWCLALAIEQKWVKQQLEVLTGYYEIMV
jgi:hypothetical protein